jgi:C4-dicarboxylate transporter DctQ subunit
MVETFTPEGDRDPTLPNDAAMLPEEAVGIVLFTAGNVLAGLQVLLRAIFDIGLVWGQELIVVFIIWSVFFGASGVTARRRHVRMDIVATLVPTRIAAMMEIAASSAVLLYAAFVLVAAWRFLFFIAGSGEVDPSIELPVWILFLGLPVGMIFLTWRSFGDLRSRFLGYRYLV